MNWQETSHKINKTGLQPVSRTVEQVHYMVAYTFSSIFSNFQCISTLTIEVVVEVDDIRWNVLDLKIRMV